MLVESFSHHERIFALNYVELAKPTANTSSVKLTDVLFDFGSLKIQNLIDSYSATDTSLANFQKKGLIAVFFSGTTSDKQQNITSIDIFQIRERTIFA